MRAYIEHRLDQRPGVQKLYYMGPMFRRERPQKGRYRQFFQIGAEAIGSESPAVDAEVIEMVVEILDALGLEGYQAADQLGGLLEVPPAFRRKAARSAEGGCVADVRDCQRRAETNPLRVLDCKVPEDQPIIEKLPSILDCLCEDCRAHFEAVKSYLHRTRTLLSRLNRGWCAASTTTCAPRSKWFTERWARRTRCWAADVTTAWPNRWARKFRRRESASRSAKTAW